MVNQALFYECELSNGVQRIITWIDERGAKEGANVQLFEEYDYCTWWKVEKVYRGPLPYDRLREHQGLNRNSSSSINGMSG
jgi:hypothetical protein